MCREVQLIKTLAAFTFLVSKVYLFSFSLYVDNSVPESAEPSCCSRERRAHHFNQNISVCVRVCALARALVLHIQELTAGIVQ